MRQILDRLSVERVMILATLLLLGVSTQIPVARYVSAQSGLGYALGIIGGSMMLLLLVYPLRKRFPALRFIGSVPQWFRIHMILGVTGPICILFHCGFSLGATNSNVALVSMLVVAGSGIVGRYFYFKIHHGLYGRKATLTELQAGAQALKAHNPALPILPELVARIEREEHRLLSISGLSALAAFAPFVVALRTAGAQRRLRGYARSTIRAAATRSPTLAAQCARLENAVLSYADRRLAATRRVAEFRIYERLFSLWHVLHLPLFFMLLASGVTHVIAVNVY